MKYTVCEITTGFYGMEEIAVFLHKEDAIIFSKNMHNECNTYLVIEHSTGEIVYDTSR